MDASSLIDEEIYKVINNIDVDNIRQTLYFAKKKRYLNSSFVLGMRSALYTCMDMDSPIFTELERLENLLNPNAIEMFQNLLNQDVKYKLPKNAIIFGTSKFLYNGDNNENQ